MNNCVTITHLWQLKPLDLNIMKILDKSRS
jgi:hypothetical protein